MSNKISIGEAAKILGVTTKTVRTWESQAKFSPKEPRMVTVDTTAKKSPAYLLTVIFAPHLQEKNTITPLRMPAFPATTKKAT